MVRGVLWAAACFAAGAIWRDAYEEQYKEAERDVKRALARMPAMLEALSEALRKGGGDKGSRSDKGSGGGARLQ